jgi:ketosteroid isomerase-like protein
MSHPLALTSLLLIVVASVVDCTSPSSPESRGPAQRASASRAADVEARDTPATRQAIAEVSALDSAEVKAFLAFDPATLARLWSDDFVVTNPFNQFVTKQQVLGLVKSGVLAFKSYERHMEYAQAWGDVVIVAGSENVVWAGKIPLAGQPSLLRYTAVWARHGNTWQEVARHANIVMPTIPAGPPI